MKHAVLAASSMYRWSNCPGSINLIAKLVSAGLVDPTRSSSYATEGRGAHELGERCLRSGAAAESFIGQFMNTEEVPVEVTEEMANAVQIYVDYVRSLSVERGDCLYFIENTFDLSTFYQGLFGTADCAAYHLPSTTLHVVDFKYGQGVPIEVVGNPQLRYYGLGALVKLQSLKLPHAAPSHVELVIVQPRAPHAAGPIRRESIPSARLLMWIDTLIEAAQATEPEEAPLHAGEHCRFCPAQTRCPELYKSAIDTARIAFAPVPKPDLASITPIRELTDEQLRRALLAAPLIDAWLRELHAYVLDVLERGQEVPGWKLVAKRALRKWTMDDVITAPELMKLGLKREDVFEPPSVRSPAQIEKLLPRARHGELKPLITKESSGVTIAPISDPRPAVNRALPFGVITEGAESGTA